MMDPAEPVSIERKRVADNELSFERLRREAIEAAQSVSGQSWTDYNTHDPGVTILEHLCYALTDVVYRADFKIADYLTGDDGRIDFASQGLHLPEHIYPCRPNTVTDYRKTIVDAVPELENVWLCEQPGCPGLYRLEARMRTEVGEDRHQEVKENILRVYNANRNLCEDLAWLELVPDFGVELEAEIDLADDADPGEILAQIYFHCASLIAGAIRLVPYETLLGAGSGLEKILTGPFCPHGYIDTDQLQNAPANIYLSDIFSTLRAVDGVARLRKLALRGEEGEDLSSIEARGARGAPRLHVPAADADIKVVLTRGGRKLRVSVADFRKRYEELTLLHQRPIHALSDISVLYQAPQGVRRELKEYVSIQNEFPPLYGIGPYGVPASAPDEVKARARQLKAYLLIFEQFIANQMASLEGVPRLFSGAAEGRATYGAQALDGAGIGDLEALYPEDGRRIIAEIVANYDRADERVNRSLDYLLALYGEVYPQEAIRQFNRYHEPAKLGWALARSKLAMFKQIVAIGRDRGAAYDCSRKVWNTDNISGLKRKVSLLLGFKHAKHRSYSLSLLKRGLKIVSDSEYRRQQSGALELRLPTLEDIPEHVGAPFQAVPPPAVPSLSRKQQRSAIRAMVPFTHNIISESLFREGIDMHRFRVGSLTGGEDYQLVFQEANAADWMYLGSYGEEPLAGQAAQALQQFLLHSNQECEGMHVLEHMLLRPIGEASSNLSALKTDDFLWLRVSLLFSGWTARTADSQFRHYAEELVRENTPAHVVVEVYWLDFTTMCEFETLYHRWLELRRESPAGSESLSRSSLALREFICKLDEQADAE